MVEEAGRERLNLKKPVEIPFTVGLKAKRDIHVLEGRIKYFVTSPKEGWCLKSSTKFSATFSTRLTVRSARRAVPLRTRRSRHWHC